MSDAASLAQCSTKFGSEKPASIAPSTAKPSEPKESRNPFSRLKKKEEPLPQWKIDQQKRFKDWEKARNKQTSSVGAFTDFYKPSEQNKAFWIWWL
ncbi:hypothetical protein CKM354_000381100 [Cercospora kikuchii]|uniref:Uncharacterized protein n=1 Tax=Cercospora kikuchii TaxID=84275 RepID=A0A9P3CHF0_9PEZI|nr:uncharacterized protein CKM354_000381100 [Cercospora kikuchii]GIZ40475.1 hypothetical protein CKM354_000381100 [Cercospora kikuchii]